MRRFRWDAAVARPLTAFGSAGAAITPVARDLAGAQLALFHLEPGGRIGHHPATVPQLLLVVAGSGRVRGGADVWQRIVAGEAVFWGAGEWHETVADVDGLTAAVLEAPALDPARYLPEVPADVPAPE